MNSHFPSWGAPRCVWGGRIWVDADPSCLSSHISHAFKWPTVLCVGQTVCLPYFLSTALALPHRPCFSEIPPHSNRQSAPPTLTLFLCDWYTILGKRRMRSSSSMFSAMHPAPSPARGPHPHLASLRFIHDTGQAPHVVRKHVLAGFARLLGST